MIEFAGHFHKHGEFSPLDAAGNANQYSWQACQNGQTHMGLTDHGRLGGILEHVDACRHPEKYEHPFQPDQKRSAAERITPILGIEAFYRPDRFMEINSTQANHLCLHAGSLNGWRTLMRLSSKSWIAREKGGGFYGKPCIDMAMLEDDHEDIIISTACIASPLSQAILAGDEKGAKKIIQRLRRYSKNHIVWFEIMPHNLSEQRELNIALVNLAEETSNPLLATGDVHIPFEDWKLLHQVVRMATYKQSFKHREAKKDAGEDVYTDEIETVFLSSAKQMFNQFKEFHPDLPRDTVLEAMANTAEFAKQVKWYTIGKTTKAPKVKVNAEKVVRQWMEEGADKKVRTYPYHHWKKWSEDEYQDRREYEFEVLKEKGVLAYMYIVADFVRWAKSTLPLPERLGNGRLYYPRGKTKRPIRIGLGRGSAAGSLVSHDIGITAIDPIPHKLLFERFLNPDRVGYPDIDIDIETELPVLEYDGKWLDGRECVKEYLKITYGHEYVVDVIAYQTFSPKVNIKEVGAVFDLSYGYLNKITDSIGDNDRNLEKIAAGNPDKDIEPNELLCDLRDNYDEVWDVLLKLEDGILRDTRHAGGVVITPKKTNFFMPTQTAVDGETRVTAYADRADFPILSDYGFLKYDILGVKSLAKQELACQLIEQHYDEQFEPNELPALRDPNDVDQKVMDIFTNGLTLGVFQFQGRGITQLLKHIRPDNATDISVANALYRPGPIAIAFEYGDRKQGKKPITYWHDSLEPILGETLGLMCFQEQAMEVVKRLGKFTGGQADAMRKAMSKLYRLPGDKAQEFMQQYYEQWVKGCEENGIPERESNPIWVTKMLPLGNYLFNRSHSSSYGLQAVQDAHIKAFYPLAFYASTLTIHKKQKKDEQQEWLRNALREAAVFDIEATAPDVNRSDRGWSIDGNKLRYGLVSIDGMGGGLTQQVMEYRPYEDFIDFVENIPSSFGGDKVVALAKAGAFDNLVDRKYLLSKTRQWGDGVQKFKIKMTCGHLKTKTIKNVEHGAGGPALINNDYVKGILDSLECKHHPDAVIDTVKQEADTYEVARYLKEHPGDEPSIVYEPDDKEIADMELAALNVSLSRSKKLLEYQPFIDSRIYTEIEIEDLPSKPRKKGKTHGSFCGCEECEASACVVGGEIVNTKVITTKKGEKMAFIDVAYGQNQYSCTLFPHQYQQFYKMIERPSIFFISGNKDDSRGATQIIVNDIVDVIEMAEEEGFEPSKVVNINRARRKRKKKGLQIMVINNRVNK